MDAKKLGLWAIFGLALAYLIAALGWAGSHMAECDLHYNIALEDAKERHEEAKERHEEAKERLHKLNEMIQGLAGESTNLEENFDKEKKILEEKFDKEKKNLLAEKNLCQAKGDPYENYEYKNINKFINNVKFQKDDVVSSAGVSMLGYIVVYSILFVAVVLGIFGTVKDNKTMMTVFSALFLISALTLFSFEMVLLAQSVHQRNAYSSAAVEEYGSFWYLKKHVFPPGPELIEHEDSTIERVNELVTAFPEKLKKRKEDFKDKKENMDEKQKKNKAKTYKNEKNQFNAKTTHTGFTVFSNAFAETAFLTAAAVAGFMLFKA